MSKLLEIDKFSLSLQKKHGIKTQILDQISLSIEMGEKIGVFGSSGSGKTILCKSILRGFDFSPIKICRSGNIYYKGKNLYTINSVDLQNLRRHSWAFLPQDPISFFDPCYKIGDFCLQILTSCHMSLSQDQCRNILLQSLLSIDFSDPLHLLDAYPSMLSRGTLQRIACALCLAKNPEILIADEPTSALDTISRNSIIKKLAEVQKMSLLITSHDTEILGVLTNIQHYVNKGKIQ
ncbi:MAG: ATP-binding cassette domain-containing protein [Spirochaetia bacterium]